MGTTGVGTTIMDSEQDTPGSSPVLVIAQIHGARHRKMANFEPNGAETHLDRFQ